MNLGTLKSIMQGHCLTVCIKKTYEELSPRKSPLLEYPTEDPYRYILCKSLKYRTDGYWEYQDSLADITINPPIEKPVYFIRKKVEMPEKKDWEKQPLVSIDLYNLPSVISPDKILVSIIYNGITFLQFYCHKINLSDSVYTDYYIEGFDYGDVVDKNELIKRHHMSMIKNYIQLGKIDWISIDELDFDDSKIPIVIYAKLIKGIIAKNRKSITIDNTHRFESFEMLLEVYEKDSFRKLELELETFYLDKIIKEGEYSYRRNGKVIEFSTTIERRRPISNSYHWYSGRDYWVTSTTTTYTKVFDNEFLAKMVIEFLKKCNLSCVSYNDFLFADATKSITKEEYEENDPDSD